MKIILVAGGAGFVGSHLCDLLLKQGAFVICLDNLSTGSRKNIIHLLHNPKFKFIKSDITEPDSFFGLIKNRKVDEIYHLASPVYYQKHPIATWQANTVGTWNLLNLAKKYRAKLLFASTSEVYGDPLVHPQTESYWGNVNPIGIRSCYDESKRAGETICSDFARQYGLNIKIVRIFNTYGPRMAENDGRVVSNFIIQALGKKPLTIYGSGRQTRSFQYVDDLVLGLVKTMAIKGFAGPVNLGNPREFTINTLAKKIIYLCESESNIIYKPLPQDDPKQRKPDIALAKRKLRWQPKIQLSEGLKKTIKYFQTGLE